MKRSKIDRIAATAPTPYPKLLLEQESADKADYSNEVSNSRMLENLKMALFFSRMQSQMNKERQNG
ncbi:hypothetical protein ACFOET_15420 [Parapedobacter deserti]|uniref:Uncharacterized protein n=1 Tax=Parapedobacter deserti TaxID=1912957 RepID=A0ABV7JRV5_9SPHI